MSADTAKILPLPSEVAAQIKSSTTISSLTGVVVGLIENSLDAGATKLVVDVNFGRGSCAVEDDGYGIPPQEFMEEGGLGKPCYTSKYEHGKDVYGGNGMFLCAVGALSLVTITSHHRSYRPQSTLILHHSRPAARFVPALQHQQLSSNGHGTRVTVQDLFGNMPVRVKHRAAGSSENVHLEERQFESLKKEVVALLLGYHTAVSVRLTAGDSKKRKVIIRPKSIVTIDGISKAHSVSGSHPQIDAHLSCCIVSQAGYIEPTGFDSWIKACARTSSVRVAGVFCLTPAPSKQVQFISLGIKPVVGGQSGNMLYDEVNKLFANSSFGNQEEYDELEGSRRMRDRRYKQDGLTNKKVSGGGKGIDRWPMFYMRIDLQDDNSMNMLERQSALQKVQTVVEAMVTGFLRNNHFRPRARIKRYHTQPAKSISSPRLSSAPPDAFSTWSRIKSSRLFHATGKSIVGPTHDVKPQSSEDEHQDDGRKAQSLDEDIEDSGPDSHTAVEQDEVVEWTNPVSKVKVLINARTGLVPSKLYADRRPTTAPAALQSSSDCTHNRITRRLSLPTEHPKPGSWAKTLLTKWENPVFAPAEDRIFKITNEISLEDSNKTAGHEQCRSNKLTAMAFKDLSNTSSAKLSKGALAAARIISQVDKKFILVDLDGTLVLIDQHAADERIRVEGLLEDLYTIPPVTLTKPLTFSISPQEKALLETYRYYFARFGIQYPLSFDFASRPNTTTPSSTGGGLFKPELSITALPAVLAQRLLTTPSLALNLIRSTAWSLHSGEITTPSDPSLIRPHPPKQILELLNSRACRSAIMFNDVLSHAECETVVQRLAKTRMPFVCAHGRTGVVPVVRLPPVIEEGALAGDTGKKSERAKDEESSRNRRANDEEILRELGPRWSEHGEEDFVGAWKRWRSNDRDDQELEENSN